MKHKYLLACASLLVCAAAYAAAPNLINYQGRLTDPSGDPVPDGNYSVTFRIYSVPSGGTFSWGETQNVTTQDGLFAVLLGSVSPLNASLFSDSVRYLGISVGADPESSPRSRLASVPYALHSNNNSGWLDEGSTLRPEDLNDRVGVGISNPPLAAVHAHDPNNTINGVRMALTQQSTGTSAFDGAALIYGSRNALLWNYENGPMFFGTSNFERMRIDSTGRVGIGTSAPLSPLVVSGFSNWGVVEVVGQDATYESTIGFRPGNLSKGSLGTWVMGVGNAPPTAGQFGLFAANGLGSGITAFSILPNGRFGIGTSSPQGALDVSSTTGAFIVPRMTTAQRDALTAVNGMIIYNTTTNQFNFREAGAWVTK